MGINVVAFFARHMDELVIINEKEYAKLKLLGKGKGGYSYLVERDGAFYVAKQIHHEPCDYYTFGDKLQSELRDYQTLKQVGVPMPMLYDVDVQKEIILKEYIDGDTIAQIVERGDMKQAYITQIETLCERLYANGLNIDYYPTNFVVRDEMLYYVDYECNHYMEQWDFAHWGRQYWDK